jgi:hypothetical protein
MLFKAPIWGFGGRKKNNKKYIITNFELHTKK